MPGLAGREVVLGVSGSIAAYKAALLLRELRHRGASVTVCLTANARRFVGPLTFRTLSGRSVLEDLFDPSSTEAVEHVALAERAAAVVVAPATADLLAKAAQGLADDALTTLLLAARGAVVFAPAMDGAMWQHPAVVANVATLRARGAVVLEPDVGELASGLTGPGRLPEIERIADAVADTVDPVRDLAGDVVLVTAGPTREPIDPVRYISNRSSGKMGYALARAAARRGAAVVLVSGPTRLEPPAAAELVAVETAEEMHAAVLCHARKATIVIKAAAVGDFRAGTPAAAKLKGKRAWALDLVPTPDILKDVAALCTGAFLVGFAAETGELAAAATAKLGDKGVDLLVANDVSRPGIGFDADDNEVLLVDRWGGSVPLARAPKARIADLVLDRVVALRTGPPR